MNESPTIGSTRPWVATDEHRALAIRAVNRRRPRWRLLFEWMKSFVIAVMLFLVIRALLVEAFKIPTGSMESTLLVGDFLLVNKAVYGAEIPLVGKRLPAIRHPSRGDVIVFEYPDVTGSASKNFVKRVIAAPGDTVESRDGVVWLNARPLDEPYVVHTAPNEDPIGDDFRWQRAYLVKSAQASPVYHPSRNNWGPLIVPEENYFVLGDNRDNSYDSRYWGFVPDSLVKGQPLVVYYSYDRMSVGRFPWLTSVRWQRIGEAIR